MKKNLTSATGALKLYQLLSREEVTKEQASAKLCIKLSTFFKCVSQLKKAGINIEKDNTRYLAPFSGTIKLVGLETSILAYLLCLSHEMFPESKTNQLKKTILKILNVSEQKTYLETLEKFEFFKECTFEQDFREKIRLLEKYKNIKNRALKITTVTKKEYILSPVDFHWGQGKVFFYFMDNEMRKKKIIPIEKIVKISPASEIEFESEGRETFFELYGRLAKSYVLKDFERIVANSPESIIVANGYCDKEILFRRLLRYDTLCKVRFPADDVLAFKKLVQKSLDNISELNDNIL